MKKVLSLPQFYKTENMEYNTSQKKLEMPEYGRNVHEMVQYAMQIEDREQRNNVAYTIIGVMSRLTPHLRDVPDLKHKLWNHLLTISDFKLDIDAPYPPPPCNEMVEKPCLVPYPQSFIRQKHYGKILIEMIRETGKLEESPQRERLVYLLVTQMRKSHLAWNRSELAAEQIIQDFLDISEGKILLNPEMKILTEPLRDIHSYSQGQSSQSHGRGGHGGGFSKKKKKSGMYKK